MKIRIGTRTLLLSVACFCVLLAVWNGFQKRAVIDVRIATRSDCTVIAPYVLQSDLYRHDCICRNYHLWLFGAVVDLPWSATRPNPSGLLFTATPTLIIYPDDEEL